MLHPRGNVEELMFDLQYLRHKQREKAYFHFLECPLQCYVSLNSTPPYQGQHYITEVYLTDVDLAREQ